MKVEIQDLRKQFGRTTALAGISFAFDAGHVFGFVGPNGAGKTTTMRIIATLDEPTGGDVLINGTSVREKPELARRWVGYVPDSLPTHADITVHEYLDFFGRAYGLRGQKLRQAVLGVEEFTNLMGIRDKLIKALSTGMKQRVSLGRALIFDPEVLVLDEPATGLDPRARVELRELLSLLAERKKAILISDLLWPEDPLPVLRRLTEGAAGAWVIQLLGRSDVDPPGPGSLRLADCESGEELDLFIDAVAEKRYRQALEQHQRQWQLACRQTRARMLTLVAESVLATDALTSLEAAGVLQAP